VAVRAIKTLLVVPQLDGDEKALFSQEATTFFWPVSETPLTAVKLAVMAPFTQLTVAEPACMKLLQPLLLLLCCRRPPAAEAHT
jgi:hypothetical protein